MSTLTETAPASADPAETHQEAMAALLRVTEEHREALATSEAARGVVADLEAAADRGETVDTTAYTTAKTDLGLKARRASALGRLVKDAEAALYAAQEAVADAHVRELAAAIPDADKAREKVIRFAQQLVTAYRARTDAVDAVYKAAATAPDIPHPSPQGATGWPCETKFLPSTGETKLGRRIGHLLVDGQRIERPNIPAEFERLTEEISRLSR